MSLKAKFLIAFLLLTVIPAGVLGFALYQNARHLVTESALGSLALIAAGKESALLSYFEAKKGRAIDFSSDGLILDEMSRLMRIEEIQDKQKAAIQLNAHLNRAKQPLDPDLAAILLLDPDGRVVAATAPGLIGSTRLREEPLYTQGRTRRYVQGLYAHGNANQIKNAFALAVPLHDRYDRSLIGVLALIYPLATIQQSLLHDMGDSKLAIYLATVDGLLVAHQGEAAPRQSEKATATLPVMRCRDEGAGSIDVWQGLSNRTSWGAARCIAIESDQRWALVVEQDERAALAPLDDTWRVARGAGIGLGIVVVLLALWISHRFTHPLRRLQQGAAAVAQGHLDYRVGSDSRDEVGELSRAFDRMTENLHEVMASRDELNHEVNERKRAEHELRHLMLELRRSNEELQQFAYVASHDLQEPLRMIASYLQLLERRYKGQLDQDASDFIAYAVDGATRMKALINGLLDYSRIQTRGHRFELTDANSSLQEAIGNLALVIEERQVQLTYDLLPTVTADAGQLTRLLQNLIGNAIKFCREQPRIHIGAQRIAECTTPLPEGNPTQGWLFSVQDNGIGIEEQYAERVFRIFQRLHGGGEYPGTGIGLAICRRIVERHGGRIWFSSRPGDGTTFYFTLSDKPEEDTLHNVDDAL